MSYPRKKKGKIERESLKMIHMMGAAIFSAMRFKANDGDPFLATLADTSVTKTFKRFLSSPFFGDTFTGKIEWIPSKRGGMQSGFKKGKVFGHGSKKVSLGVIPLNGAQNIYSERAFVGSTFIITEEGGLRTIPEGLYMNAFIARKKGNYSFWNMDTTPDSPEFADMVDTLTKKIRGKGSGTDRLRVIVSIGQRHMSTDPDEFKKGKRLVDGLVKAGVHVETEEYSHIESEVRRTGIFHNGNILFVDNMSLAVLKLVETSTFRPWGADTPYDVILGSDMAMNYAQAAFMIKAFGKGQGQFRFESRISLKDKKTDSVERPNLYNGRTFTGIDRGTLREADIFPDDIEIDRSRKQIHSSDVLRVGDIVRARDGAMIFAVINKCYLYSEFLKNPNFQFRPDRDVRVSILWIGLSGDVRVHDIVYDKFSLRFR